VEEQNPVSHAQINELIAHCQAERRTYHQTGSPASPACVELFRRAFAGDQDAWAAIQAVFEPLMRAWVGVQHHVEPDDVLQEALIAFARWAPQHPELVAGDEVSRPLAFLRQCTKTALLMQLRSARRRAHLSLDQLNLPLSHDVADAVETRLIVHDRTRQLIVTPQEQLVFDELLVYGLKPQDIFRRHPDQFPDLETLRTVIQRVLRRLRKDPMIREL
jgi:DNA-directed RNA polymerase specialized sigma24 family protein